MHPDAQPPAPAVVAVVVTCDPGPWLEQALTSLATQDYPNLSLLVVDAASDEDPTPRIAAVASEALVVRLDRRVGFGRAANEALKRVDGASHLLFCHDDVVLDTGAVRALVEEAFRANAGVTTPKYVEWDHPDRLLALGATTDKVGVVQELVDPGELDQEQHDVVREVLVAPSGVMLIRTDLIRALGGFNATIDQFGEDLDLSWRARVAGARIVVVPQARVRHLQALRRGERPGWATPVARQRAARLADEHRIRTLLSCYRWWDVAWILPLAWVYIFGEAVTRLLQGRPGDAWHTLAAFGGAFRHPARLWRSRQRVQRRRRAGDRDIRRLQVRGNARFRAFVRTHVDDVREGLPPAPLASPDAPDRAGDGGSGRPGARMAARLAAARAARARYAQGDRPGRGGGAAPYDGNGAGDGAPAAAGTGVSTNRRVTALVAVALVAVLIFGSRSLFGHALPAVGQVPNTSTGWSSMWRAWWSTWQPNGLGVAAPSTPALGLLWVLDTVLLGATGVLQHVLVLGPLVIGPLGAYRAGRWWGSRRGRLAALIAYAIIPLPYNALARGHWPGLIAYAAAPWVLALICRLSGEIPFPSTTLDRAFGRIVALGLLVAVTAAFVPSWWYVVPAIGLALLVGSALVGRPRQGVQMLAVAAGASVAALVLLLPWAASVLGRGPATFGLRTDTHLSMGQLLRFATGPVGHGPLGWALLAAAALPLFIGRGWRLAWAARLWVVALVFVWLTWAGLRGWIPSLPVEVGLAPAAAALAGSVALGAVAFELDLPGYRFGWRQLAAGLAGVGLAVAAIPMLTASGQGRWHLPSADATSVLAFLPDSHDSGDYRVLWVGAPDALPLAGRSLGSGLAYATSSNGEPALSDVWATGPVGATPVLASDLRLAEGRLTTKLGHLLAPLAVRYLVIPNHNGPGGSGAVSEPVPGALLNGMLLQTDLQVLNVDPDYVVYLNSAWAPGRAVLPPSASRVAAAGLVAGSRVLQQTDLSGSTAVFNRGHGRRTIVGAARLAPGSTVYVSATRDSSWRLHVAGASIASRPAFGWAMRFTVPPTAAGATATLQAPPSWTTRLAQIVGIVLWAVAIGVAAIDLRRRRSEHPPRETVRPEWFAPMAPASRRSGWRRADRGGFGAEDLKGDEVWIDV
jgi:GT2 family glycosyltransferase